MGDLISRRAAELALLEKGQRSTRYKLGDIWELNFSEIREALSDVPDAGVPNAQTDVSEMNVGDLIRRLDAIDVVCIEGCGQCRNALATIPDADPKDAEKVYWESGITGNGNARCPKCGFVQIAVYDDEGFQAYCGHCGKKMAGVRRSALWRSRT